MTNLITDVTVAIITDSRGTPTISVSITAGGYTGSFSVPGGASTGSREVLVLDPAQAVQIIEEKIKPALIGTDVTQQATIDALLHELDQSTLFSTIGGNVALGVSVAAAKTAALVSLMPTWQYVASLFGQPSQAAAPRLFVNLINGGKHAIHGSAIQEHQIIVDTDNVSDAYAMACRVQLALQEILENAYGANLVTQGDEGGFVIPSKTVFEPFDYLQQAIDVVKSTVPIYIGADIAASSFYTEAGYTLDGEVYTPESLVAFYQSLHAHIPALRYVEDPFFESDFQSYSKYAREHQEVVVIGDDLTTTNVSMLTQAIAHAAIGGIIIKPNQIGTLSDTLQTMQVAYAHGIKCIVSHRSGETMDDFIADLAFGTRCFGLKAGAPQAKEREAKYQRLIHITQMHHD